jgi:hypothetical protein
MIQHLLLMKKFLLLRDLFIELYKDHTKSVKDYTDLAGEYHKLFKYVEDQKERIE